MSKTRLKLSRSRDKAVIKIKTEKNWLGFLKTSIVLFLIALQFALLAYFYFRLARAFKSYLFASMALSVLSCLFLLSSNRSSASKAVWTFVILTFFYVGFILYIISDQRLYFLKSKRRYRKVFAQTESQKPTYNAIIPQDERTKQDIEYLVKTGNFTVFNETSTQYFPSGGLFFDDVLDEIGRAESFIFIEFFIVCNGILLERLLEILHRKILEGVEVRMIYDDMGSHSKLTHKTKKRMAQMGIKLMAFSRILPIANIGLSIRDHRKIIVIDGKIAYTGGANIADEYTNEARMFGYWKDSGVKIEGPAVDGFTFIFLRQWDFICDDTRKYDKYLNLATEKKNFSVCIPFSAGLDFDDPIGKELYLNMISKSSKFLYIMTPYLVPDDSVMNMLVNKAKCGVDVRIVLPEIPDKQYVYWMTLDNARRLSEGGVKVFLMKDSFVHSKVVLTDYSTVIGSINMDMRSFYQQFESALYSDDKTLLNEVKRDFDKTFNECRELTKKENTFINRTLAVIFKLVAPLM